MEILVAATLLAACGVNRPPAPTAEDAAQLDEAEKLLNEQAEAEKNAP